MYLLGKQVRKICWAWTGQGFRSGFENFLFNAFIYWQTIKLLKEQSNVAGLPSSKNEARCHILSKLQRPERAFRKACQKKVTVVSTTKNQGRT